MGRVVKAVLGLGLLGGLLGLTGCDGPGVITVTTTADVVADDDLTSLREAFAIANRNPTDNIIQLEPYATYELTDCTAGALVHTTASTVTVNGGEVTIHQTCPNTGVLASTQADSALRLGALTLTGGPNTGVTMVGAAVNVRGSLRMDVVEVFGVDAGPDGTVIDGNGGSPAEDDIFLYNSSVGDNTGTGISIRDGRVHLEFVSVSGNVGDGVRLLGTSSYFSTYGSLSSNTGWGLNVQGTGDSEVATLSANSITANGGGGLSCVGCARMILSEIGIQGNGTNARDGEGGGIAFIAIQNTFEPPQMLLHELGIADNQARRAGGGLFVGLSESSWPGASGPVISFDGSLRGNRTVGDGHHGGGIAVTAGALHLGSTRVTENIAGGAGSDGGGVYFGPVSGWRSAPVAFSTSDDVLARNWASGNGGAIAVDTTAPITLEGSDIGDNTAGGNGGGAHILGDATIRRVSAHGNLASGKGGGAYVLGESTLQGVNFDRNRAAEGGGAFVTASDRVTDVTVAGSAFVNNTATSRGGGLGANGVRALDLTNSTVSGNYAPRGGGIAMADEPPGGAEEAFLHFTTVAGNISPIGANLASEVRLETYGSVFAEPLGGGTNCAVDPGDRYPWGYSFVSDASCGLHPTDLISAEDPQLGLLEPGLSFPPGRTPAPTSPIAGLVPAAACDVETDQHDTSRPQGGACEAGSIEIVEAVGGDAPSGSLARL